MSQEVLYVWRTPVFPKYRGSGLNEGQLVTEIASGFDCDRFDIP
ncbi:hypothetical protein CKA32_003804 [Geitlerinema sp. FC II]|nr:hypothetical protein CKA32_003804 [Geitlerinema sp. FC II]